MTWLREAMAVFLREIRSEWRTRVAVSAVVLFAVGALLLILLALQVHPAPGLDGEQKASLAAALVWVVLFFTAATGLGRAYVLEEERGTALALRLSARASTVWAGKFAANAVLLLILTAISIPLLLSGLKVVPTNFVLLVCVLFLGILGMAATFTLVSALVAQASSKGGLLPVLAFPVLLPLLVAAVHGTKAALGMGNADGKFFPFVGDLQVVFSYTVVVVTTGLLLIDFIWND